MKRIVLALFAFLLTFSLMPVAAQQGKTYYVNVRAAKVRAEASSTSKLVTTLERNKPVVVLDVVKGEKVSGVDTWYKVNASGNEGYILSSLLTDRAPVVTSNTTSSSGSSSNVTMQSVAPTPLPPPAPASSSSNAVPAGNGATALCNDGTYSYAAHHQGACSHHGGVSVFYK